MANPYQQIVSAGMFCGKLHAKSGITTMSIHEKKVASYSFAKVTLSAVFGK